MASTRRGRAAAGSGEEEVHVAGGVQHSPVNNAPNVMQSPPNIIPPGNEQAHVDLQMNLHRMMEIQMRSLNMMQVQHNESMAAIRASNEALLGAFRGFQDALIQRPATSQRNVRERRAGIPPNANEGDGNQARTHHLKTSDVKMPVYSGATDVKTPYDYILELEKYQNVLGYSDEEMLENVISLSLKGDAYNWYRYEPRFNGLADFKSRLRKEFQALGYKTDLKRELDNRYQGTNEPLTAFIRIIVDYYERIGDNDTEVTIANQIKRLMHPEYRKALLGMPSESLADLKASAPQAQELIKSYRSYRLPPISGSLEPSLAWKPVSKMEHKEIPQTIITAEAMPAGWNSPPKLHMAAVDPYAYFHSDSRKEVRFANPLRSQSPERTRTPSPNRNDRRCYICSAPDHIAPNCPKKMDKGKNAVGMFCDDSDEEVITISASHRDKRPLMTIEVLGIKFPAFMDTGSSISVIGNEVIDKLNEKGMSFKNKTKTIRFLKGTLTATKAVTLTVDFERGSRRHTFYLVPNTIKTILLGRDFLGPAQIAVHIGEGGWSIGPSKDEIIPFLPSKGRSLLADECDETSFAEMFIVEENSESETESNECPYHLHTKDMIEFPCPNLGKDVPSSEEKCHYPAEILVACGNELLSSSDEINEESLFPDTENSCIKAPSSLSPEQRQQPNDDDNMLLSDTEESTSTTKGIQPN